VFVLWLVDVICLSITVREYIQHEVFNVVKCRSSFYDVFIILSQNMANELGEAGHTTSAAIILGWQIGPRANLNGGCGGGRGDGA
jgi:hypothetical protein